MGCDAAALASEHGIKRVKLRHVRSRSTAATSDTPMLFKDAGSTRMQGAGDAAAADHGAAGLAARS